MSTQIVVHLTYGFGAFVVPQDLCLIDDNENDSPAFRPLEKAEMQALNRILEKTPNDELIVILSFIAGQKPVKLTPDDIAKIAECDCLSGARIIHQKIAAKAARLTTNCVESLHNLAGIDNDTALDNGIVNSIFSVTKEGKNFSLLNVQHDDDRDFSCGIICVQESDTDKHYFRMITPHTADTNHTRSAPIVEKNACEFLAQCPVIWQAVLVEASSNRGSALHDTCVVARVGDPAHLQKLKHLGGVHGHTSLLAAINLPLPYKQITGIHIDRNGNGESIVVLDKNSPIRASLTVQEFLLASQKISGFMGASQEDCKLFLFPVDNSVAESLSNAETG